MTRRISAFGAVSLVFEPFCKIINLVSALVNFHDMGLYRGRTWFRMDHISSWIDRYAVHDTEAFVLPALPSAAMPLLFYAKRPTCRPNPHVTMNQPGDESNPSHPLPCGPSTPSALVKSPNGEQRHIERQVQGERSDPINAIGRHAADCKKPSLGQ
jgi:hypothetical protein